MRRRVGAALLICGALLLLASGGTALFQTRQDEQAGRTARQAVTALEQLTDGAAETDEPETGAGEDAQPSASPAQRTPEPDETVQPSAVEIDGERYIGVLRIPALGLELPVMEDWSYARLRIAPCRQFGSAEGGNLVIAAHNYKSHFGRLKELEQGDEVTFTDLSGAEYAYCVERVENVQPQDVSAVTESGALLTLYTCTPGGKTRVAVYCAAKE